MIEWLTEDLTNDKNKWIRLISGLYWANRSQKVYMGVELQLVDISVDFVVSKVGALECRKLGCL